MARYGTIESRQPENPPIALRPVPHKGKILIASKAFGPGTYAKNLAKMQKTYSHDSDELGNFPRFTFRPATTSESISTAAYNFKNETKPQIFDPNWLQAGRIVRTQEGVFTNTQETDETKLKAMLDKAKEVNGIYLVSDTIAFAPYESFKTGIQEEGKFVEGGLARALEHTTGKKAENLAGISAPSYYKLGVNVWGFDQTNKPALRVADLGSGRGAGSGRLDVGGDWDGDYSGFAFGVLNSVAEGDAPEN